MLSQFDPWAVLAQIQSQSDGAAKPANPAKADADPVVYREALPHEQCDRCRELASQGVAVLACSECDVRLEVEP